LFVGIRGWDEEVRQSNFGLAKMLAHLRDLPHHVKVPLADQLGHVPAICYDLPAILKHRQRLQLYVFAFGHKKSPFCKSPLAKRREKGIIDLPFQALCLWVGFLALSCRQT
jgi:hypothetical protein